MSPAGVCTVVEVTPMSPIWTITGPGAIGAGAGGCSGAGTLQGSLGVESGKVTPTRLVGLPRAGNGRQALVCRGDPVHPLLRRVAGGLLAGLPSVGQQRHYREHPPLHRVAAVLPRILVVDRDAPIARLGIADQHVRPV